MADDEAEDEAQQAAPAEPAAAPAGTTMPAWVGGGDASDGDDGDGGRRRKVRPRLVALGLGAVLVAAWGWRSVTNPGPGRTPAQTVSAFFDAQRTGDCERLIDVLTEASWSQDGRRSRDDFLDQCADALVGYHPPVGRVVIEVDDDGKSDRATVFTGGRTFETDEPEGRLVREDGAWRVEPDPEVLRIGRSVDDTLRGYVDAFNDRDCEGMLDYLAETTWSQDGTRSDSHFLTQCAAALTSEPDEPPLVVGGVDVERDGDRALADTAVVTSGAPTVDLQEPESTLFVREDLTWTVAGVADASGEVVEPADGDAPVPLFEVPRLQSHLVDEVRSGDRACATFIDSAVPHPEGYHPARSIQREFSCDVAVTLYRFDDDIDARLAAEIMVNKELADLPPTATDLAETTAANPALGEQYDQDDLERFAASYRPNEEARVPGLPHALGVHTFCSADGCSGSVVLGVRSGVLVRVDGSY
ncbi:MAG TPA: hypothetical protein VGO78_25415, partial [Acidimicrobiales bacterium]|nr:hypothetical protein [Acidimicrobiales bacterium]